MMTKRQFLLSGASLSVVGIAAGKLGVSAMVSPAAAKAFEVIKTDAEWKKMLSPLEYNVLRHEGTERAFTSPLLREKRKGNFHCRGCDLALYPSDTKYDSRTGWPSFWQPLDNAVATKIDKSLFSVRTEVHCRRCGGHMGHIFNDGPKPTGKRHCINGASLTFRPTSA